MIGEGFALIAALFYALVNVSVALGGKTKQEGDNGVLLSLLSTLTLSGVVWVFWGAELDFDFSNPAFWVGFLSFMVAGILSTVLGRLWLFRSVERIGVVKAGFFRRLIPVFSALFAYVFLKETLSTQGTIGFILVLLATFYANNQQTKESPNPASAKENKNRKSGGLYGVASSVSYAGAYVLRKEGMRYLPDAAFGTFVGAVTGLIYYVTHGVWQKGVAKHIVANIFGAGRWQLMTAVCISIGQLSQFFALKYTSVAIVAIIGMMDLFLSIILASYMLKIAEKPNTVTLVCAVISTLGVVLIIF